MFLLAYQLNTPHLSESLVLWVAHQIGFTGTLSKKGHRGILQNQLTRMTFLQKGSPRIRFVFTPKHCSWLNPVENYFAKLQRQVITNARFTSVKEHNSKIQSYVCYYNSCLSKPLNWKFKGFSKDKP